MSGTRKKGLIFIRSKIKGKGIHTASEEGLYLDRELSKQYLTGTLSSRQKYQLEDRLLEHDFSFEAMEGLEHVSWQECERHLLETESRIIEEFSLKQPSFSRGKILTLIGVLAGSVLAAWYFSTGPDTVNLSSPEIESAQNATVENEIEQPKVQNTPSLTQDSVALGEDTLNLNPELPATDQVAQINIEKQVQTSEIPAEPGKILEDEDLHIAVGRVIDVKGLAIVNATVQSGKASDTTDNYGYFALKVPMGGTQIIVTHLSTKYPVEIDTNQNWEIVLDIVNRKVHDYSPMNAANRFK